MNDKTSEIEDIYELSPLQEGMLIHTLRDQGIGMYVNQGVYRFEQLNIAALESAWQSVVDRHGILRTSFQWEDLDSPQQVVHRQISIKIESHDWRDLSPWQQEWQLRQSLREDRNRGFALTEPPLLRLLLFQCSQHSSYLVFSHHHLLLDGWSHPLLLAEVREFYQALLKNQRLILPPPRPYREYINWLRKQELDKTEAFWREYLRGITAPTPLPADLGDHRQKGFQLNFEEWRTVLPGSLCTALQSVARKCHVTLNTLILGAWALVLSRYSGQQDVVFGMLVSGRPPTLEGVESMIGMFLNTLPVRVKVEANQPLSQWLKQIQKQQSDLQQYEFSPLRMVQSWSEIPRGLPLFESMVDTNNTPQQRMQESTVPNQGDGAGKVLPASIRQNFPLLLDIQPVADGLVMTLTYNVRRFLAASITQLAEQLRTLLTAIAEEPDQYLGELPLMSARERNRVVFEWNETQRWYPRHLCLHQLFEAQVERKPSARAISYLTEQLTYGELNEQANKLAHQLRRLGVGPGTPVGLCLERSLPMVTGLLAILKAGGAYVPLAPNYPLARLKFMLQDAQVNVLLTQEKMLAPLEGLASQIICLDRDQSFWENQPASNPENLTDPEELAYLLYTSGSTGTPKGVAVPHRVAVNRLHTEYDPFEPEEALCVKTSLSFVDSIWEMFSAWHHGLSATLVPERHVQDPSLLVATLAEAGATRIVLVPSLLRSLLDSEIDLAKSLPQLQHWISSGEPLPSDLCAKFAQRLPEAVLTNLYGTSEIWDATRCDSRQCSPGEPIPIGRPLGNVRVYVLDELLRPVPIGIPGELYIGGDSLARGYWCRPDLTAEKFIPDPFSQAVGQRLYKTGDLVRWLPDGNLEYLDRLDQQLKLRGFRLEIEEIESVLRQHPQSQQAAVTVTNNEQLVAYIVTKDGQVPKTEELRQFASSRLPEYMVPIFYLALSELPLTPSGKVDRRALPTPKAAELDKSVANGGHSRPPQTPTEKTIARLWAEMLGVKVISADSDFFHLGGHSLLAARIASRLSKVLKLQVPISALFEERTIGSLARWIDTSKEKGISEKTQVIPDLTRTERGKIAPLSFPQQRMWFLDQLNPGSLSYTVGHYIRFAGRLDFKALRLAFKEIVRRHESLRTTFIARDGEPFQVIHDSVDVPLPVIELTKLPESEREAMARDYRREQVRKPWDLVNGPLFRASILRFSRENHVFSLTMHHIITDGHSLGIFAHELSVLYSAFVEGRSSPLPELPLQYADFAIWQHDWFKGKHCTEQLNYWQGKLGGSAQLELPTDRPRPLIHRYRGGRQAFQLGTDLVKQLQALAEEEGATMFMVLLSGFQWLLSRYSGQEDISVGTPVANRDQEILDHLIGFFVNTLVIRTDLSGNPTFRQLLRRVKQTCLDAYNNQDLPFDKLVEVLKPQRDLSWNPLFQVMFVYQKAARNTVDVSGVSWQPQGGTELETSNFDLLLLVTETNAEIDCTLQYNSDLFEPTTVERMGSHLKLLFERIAANLDRPLFQIPLLSEFEQRQLLIEWNNSSSGRKEERFIHELIEEKAAQNPEQTAVCFNQEILSYRELDHRSNQLARYLQALGIGTESIVGCCFERSPEMLIGLLGTLKAGGAFLSLDPEYPRERLEYMLDDSRVSTVLTQQRLKDIIPHKPSHLICLDRDWEKIADQDDRTVDCQVHPHNLAYIVYTSGSTGVPKGVMIEHGSLTNVICGQIPKFGISPDSRVLQMLSTSFDAAFGEIFRTLVGGATLFLVPKEQLLPGPSLIDLLRERRITTVTMSVASLGALPSVNAELPDLQTLTVGGEACLPELAARWSQGRQFINGYGPTETTIGATLATEWNMARKPPLGRPLPHVCVYVLDGRMQPVPVGIPGELYIGGSGVARGYLNRPDLTAEKFIPNPFSEYPGDRLYRTGDLVRWLSDGNLDFLGRIDQQVKIRGFRIELSEVESVLSKHEKVGQCVVDVREEGGVRRLVGYLTAKDQEKPSPSELRDFLTARLPNYMIPAFLMVLPSLPLTVNGKVDRKALPTPGVDRLTLETPFVAPRTQTEKVLAGIWAKVLGLEQVGIYANFFELGGDSIMSIQIVARATDAGLKFTAKDLFEHQTIAELAQVVSIGEVIEAEQELVTGQVPLTPVQHWFFSHNPPAPHHFNQWLTLQLPYSVNSSFLRQALEYIIEHHDSLRLQFTKSEEGWQQSVVPPYYQTPFLEIDLSQVNAKEQQQQFEEELKGLQASLNLNQGLLLRLVWFNLGWSQPGYLVLIIHHLAVDNVSWPILVEDLMTAYRQLHSGQPVRLPRKTTSFKQWAEALAEYASSEVLKNESPYWLNLGGLEVARLPVDHTIGVNSKDSTDTILVSLNEEDTQVLLQEITRIYKVKINDILLTALAVVICRWTGDKRVLINVEGHGREDIGVELNVSRTVGWFTSFYPLLLEVDDSKELSDMIKSVHEQLSKVPNRGIGYSVLRYLTRDLEIQERLAELPAAEIAFNYTGQQAGKLLNVGQMDKATGAQEWLPPKSIDVMLGQIGLSESKQGNRRHLLEIVGGVMGNQLLVRWAYSARIHESRTINRIASDFLNILQKMRKLNQGGEMK